MNGLRILNVAEVEWDEILRIIRGMAFKRCYASGRWDGYENMVSAAAMEAALAERRWKPEGGSSLKNFVLLRARGAMLDELKHRWYKRTESLPEDYAAPDWETLMIRKMDLMKALGALNPVDRDCLVRFEQGEPVKEIGARLGVTGKRVSQRLGQARQNLKKFFEGAGV